MPAETDLTDTIAQAAADPAEAQGDEGRVRAHSLRDLIAADRHLAAKAALAGGTANPGIRIGRITPPGAI